MPKNKVTDPITDQEIAFARLVLSGTMTDRHAAEAVGLNPDSAAYTKSKPHVRDYMHQHRAAVQQQLVQQEADGLRRLNLDREKVLDRLWEIANLSPEMTRGSITGQVKALSMIIAMENFIPDRRARQSAPAANTQPQTDAAACPPRLSRHAVEPAQAHQEDVLGASVSPGVPQSVQWKPAPGSAEEAPPAPGPNQSTFNPAEAPPLVPYAPGFRFVPDARGPFSNTKNPFVHPR